MRKTLEIYVQYGNVDAESLRQRMRFVVEVRDTDLVILAETSVNSGEPALVHLDDNVDIAFVYLIWPSGKKERQKAELSDAVTRVFFGGRISRNEWAAWAVPRLGAASAAPQADGRGISFFSDAWMQIWRYDVQSNRWLARPVQFKEAKRGESDSTLMIELDLDAAPHMLHVGGTALPTKLFSLPAPGPCRVLLTPNLSSDPRADPLKVAVTGDRSEAESLIEYLVHDQVSSVRTFADEMTVARELFDERREDPLAGVVGAYVYLRCGHWRDVKVSWFHNLYAVSRETGICADAALVLATVQLRRGELDRKAWEPWINLISDSVTKGMPVFAEAHALLRECAVAMSRMEGAVNDAILRFIRTLVDAQAWAGGMFSYYGMSPAAPTLEKLWNVRPKSGLVPQPSLPPARMPTSTERRRTHALRGSPSEGAAQHKGQPASLTEDALFHMASPSPQADAAGTQHALDVASASAGIPVCISEDRSETRLADISPLVTVASLEGLGAPSQSEAALERKKGVGRVGEGHSAVVLSLSVFRRDKTAELKKLADFQRRSIQIGFGRAVLPASTGTYGASFDLLKISFLPELRSRLVGHVAEFVMTSLRQGNAVSLSRPDTGKSLSLEGSRSLNEVAKAVISLLE